MSRYGRKFVPSHVIRDRMDRVDLRFQAEARRRAEALDGFKRRTAGVRIWPVVEPAPTEPDCDR